MSRQKKLYLQGQFFYIRKKNVFIEVSQRVAYICEKFFLIEVSQRVAYICEKFD